jgi:hypothetical protein
VSGQLHAPAALPPGKEPPGTYWIGGWVDSSSCNGISVKGKVAHVLNLIKDYGMKAYGGSGRIDPHFSILALGGGEWSASRPGRFTSVERAPGTHCIGGWVDPRAGLDDVEKRTFLTLP